MSAYDGASCHPGLSVSCLRRALPTTCSQISCVPNLRNPNMWVTFLASHPSVSIDTDMTHRIPSPRRPGLPTVSSASRTASRPSPGRPRRLAMSPTLSLFSSAFVRSPSARLLCTRSVRTGPPGRFANRPNGRPAPAPRPPRSAETYRASSLAFSIVLATMTNTGGTGHPARPHTLNTSS